MSFAQPLRRALLAIACLLAPIGIAQGQGQSCNSAFADDPNNVPQQLMFFQGTYTVTSVTAADSPDSSAAPQIGNLVSINIPDNMGVRTGRFGSHDSGIHYDYRNHFNPTTDGGHTFGVQFGDHPGSGPLSHIPGSLLYAQTMNWCFGNGNGFNFRSGVMQDLRWSGDNIITGSIGCVFSSEGQEWCKRSHMGPPLCPTPTATPDSTGFPFLDAHLGNSDNAKDPDNVCDGVNRSADAENWTQALYGGDVQYSMAVFRNDFNLWGTVQPVTVHYDKIEKKCGFLGMFCNKDARDAKDVTGLQRGMVGEVRRHTWLDPRVGVPDSAASVESRMTVVFVGGTESHYDDGETNAMMERYRNACRNGCAVPQRPLAEGQVQIPGASDSLHYAQLCAKHASTASSCATDSTNPLDSASRANGAQKDSGVAGRSVEDLRITAMQRIEAGRGVRMMGPDSVASMSQHERICLTRAQDDSMEIANGPVAPGFQRPVVSIDSLVRACEAQWTPLAGSTPYVTQPYVPPVAGVDTTPRGGTGGVVLPPLPADTALTPPDTSSTIDNPGFPRTPRDGGGQPIIPMSGRLPSRSRTPAPAPVCREYYGITMCRVNGQWVKKGTKP